MTTKSKNPSIHVETIPNGYIMSVDGCEYMFHNPTKLLAGVFYHVGLQKLDYIDSDHIESIMEAIMSWPTIKDAAISQANSRAQMKSMRHELQITQQHLARTSDSRLRLISENKELIEKLDLAQKRLIANSEINARLDEVKNELEKQRRHNVALENLTNDQRKTITYLKRRISKLSNSAASGDEEQKERINTKPPKKKTHRSRKLADDLIREEMEKQSKL